jgi:hypothetical protein
LISVRLENLARTAPSHRALFPDNPPLRTENDQVEACALAALACASPGSGDAMLEAGNLIRENLGTVLALVDGMVDTLSKGTMPSVDHANAY